MIFRAVFTINKISLKRRKWAEFPAQGIEKGKAGSREDKTPD